MPELPEVEGYRRYFERHALDRVVTALEVLDRRIVSGVAPSALARAMRGGRFTRTRRHGKHLFAHNTNGKWLYLHFGMTGDLVFGDRQSLESRFPRVIVGFDSEHALAFDDPRLFGRAGLVGNPDEEIARRRLGPDPLALSAAELERLLSNKRGAMKSLLMNQTNLAGLGNLYVDELLFQTGIHPRTLASSIDSRTWRTIYSAMQKILRRAIDAQTSGASLPRSWLLEHRVEGDACPRCGGTIARETHFGRTSYFCTRHQRP